VCVCCVYTSVSLHTDPSGHGYTSTEDVSIAKPVEDDFGYKSTQEMRVDTQTAGHAADPRNVETQMVLSFLILCILALDPCVCICVFSLFLYFYFIAY
jgi:hypothetical protein